MSTTVLMCPWNNTSMIEKNIFLRFFVINSPDDTLTWRVYDREKNELFLVICQNCQPPYKRYMMRCLFDWNECHVVIRRKISPFFVILHYNAGLKSPLHVKKKRSQKRQKWMFLKKVKVLKKPFRKWKCEKSCGYRWWDQSATVFDIKWWFYQKSFLCCILPPLRMVILPKSSLRCYFSLSTL